MWTRTNNKETGKHVVECFDYSGNLAFSGEYDSAFEADRAGEAAERRNVMLAQIDAHFGFSFDPEVKELSMDELFAELDL